MDVGTQHLLDGKNTNLHIIKKEKIESKYQQPKMFFF